MKNELIIRNVTFNGADLLALQDQETEKIYTGINLLLEDLGFNDYQVRYRRDRWMEDKVISKGVRKFPHPLDRGGLQETYCIDIMKLPLALAKIDITPSMERELPGLVERLEVYQDRCAEVLSGEFMSNNQQQQQPRVESLDSINIAVQIVTPLLEKAGCSDQVQLLTVRSLYEKGGVLIPIEIQADQQYWDTVHIARKAGVYYKSSGKPVDKAVNEIIRKIGVAEGEYTDTWEFKGSWQGTVRKYTESVIEKIQCWIADNDLPSKISYKQSDGQTKNYHVTYKNREVA